MIKKDNTDFAEADLETLTKALCSWFVRRDSKFYSVNRLGTKLSRDDVVYIALSRFRDEFGEMELSDALLREVFDKAISKRHAEPGMTIPVWNGREIASRDRVVRHRCHNRLCVNPRHLEIGSQADNKRDDWEHWAYGVDWDYL